MRAKTELWLVISLCCGLVYSLSVTDGQGHYHFSSDDLALPARTAQASEEDALRYLTNQFHKLANQQDLSAFYALWSERSPQRDKAKAYILDQRKEGLWNPPKSVAIGKIIIEGRFAKVRTVVEQIRLDEKTRKPVGIENGYQTLLFARETGGWKLMRFVTTEQEIALTVMSAPTDRERLLVFEREKESLPPNWRQRCIQQGLYLRRAGENDLALAVFSFTRLAADRTGDPVGSSMALNLIANIKLYQGALPEALQLANEAYELLAAVKGEEAEVARGGTILNLAEIYLAQGTLRNALDYYRRAVEMFDPMISKESRRSLAAAWLGLGNTQLMVNAQALGVDDENKKLESAKDCFNRSLKISESFDDPINKIQALIGLGNACSYQKDYACATRHYEEALEANADWYYGDKGNRAVLLVNLAGALEAQGRHQESFQKASEAEAIARDQRNLNLGRLALTRMGRAYRSLNQPEKALEALSLAVKLTESLGERVIGTEANRVHYFEDKYLTYFEMVDLLVSRNRFEEALAYAERSKARVLSDTLRNGLQTINRKLLTKAEVEREEQLQARIVEMIKKCKSLPSSSDQKTACEREGNLVTTEYNTFRDQLFIKYPALSSTRGGTRSASLSEIGQFITDSGTVLVEYVTGVDKTIVFVIAKRKGSSAPTVIARPISITESDLRKKVESFRSLLRNRPRQGDQDRLEKTAADFYQLLVAPVEQYLRGGKRLVIVPDKTLWEVPFQALIKQSSNRTGKESESFLIEQYAISYAPSLTALHIMKTSLNNKQRPAISGKKTLLAFGDPFPLPAASKLNRLEHAGDEVRSIEQIVGKSRCTVYNGGDATESRVKEEATGYRFLHFATHGVLLDNNPLSSHLLLAPTQDDSLNDGKLTGLEIMRLNLNAEMVVLSACNTSQGSYSYGEGVIGMTWAFFVAGIPVTIASQWNLADSEPTRKLMEAFYQSIFANKPRTVSKPEALQKAMIKLLRTPSFWHPHYWAGFIVLGSD